MIAVAVTDTMKVTANIIITAASVDNPESSTLGALSPAKTAVYYTALSYMYT